MKRALAAAVAVALATASPVMAANDAPVVNGAAIRLLWALPFVGILLSIAILPLATPAIWHRHFGKISAAWAAAVAVPFALFFGVPTALYEILHIVLLEYVPFIILLLALFTVTGGIHLEGNLRGSPAINTALLAIGTALAGWMGTTGASMLMIRTVIRANDDRRHKVHVFVFFIILVSNVGGALTPLGDPPLFLGFLRGVDFFWVTRQLFDEMLFATGILLLLFYGIDKYWYRREGHLDRDPTPDAPLSVRGSFNLVLLAAIVGVVLVSGSWKPGIDFTIFHVRLELQNLLREVSLLAICALSLLLTHREVREANDFSWGPIIEVAKLFAGIFITIAPVIAMLRAGREGALSGLVDLVTSSDGQPINAWYFWLSGALSSFLDNAPTYLVFFNLAGGDPVALMGPLANTLVAISCGAVFMGANTYIGNAPNFMVKAIVEKSGIRMPSFFGYMGWAGAILLPLFAIMTPIFFR